MKNKQLAKMLLTVLLTAFLFTGNVTQLHATEYDVQVNGTGYASLQEAVDAISPTAESDAEKTVKLLANFILYEDCSIPEDKTVILDLNDHVINMNEYRIINNGTLTITDSSATPTTIKWDENGNRVTGSSDGYETFGGVLYDGDDRAITNNGELKLEKGNIVSCGAPAVYNAASKTFTMTDGHILYSRIVSEDGSEYAGGVNNEGTFNMSGGVIGENVGYNAGGVYNVGTFTLTGGSVVSNSSPLHEAGGVYNSGTFTMSAGSIEDNSAPLSSGGGVYNCSNFTFSGGTIGYNEACDYGGGVFNCSGATFKMTGGTVNNNSTVSHPGGGGVYNQGTMTMTAGKIVENTSKSMGGGLINDGKFTMEGGSISDNTSENDGPGVVNWSEFIMKGGTISSNYATTQYAWGGGISSSGSVEMSGGEIKGNSAANGGGVCINNGSFTLTEGKISENKASDGGGVYVAYSSASFIMTDGEITGNEAETDNAAIYSDGPTSLLGGEITGNCKTGDSGSDRGAVYVSSIGNLELGGDIVIKDNVNDEDPCNLYFNSSNEPFVISDQYPLKDGAEIYIAADTYPMDLPFVTNANSKADAQYFFSDNEDYGVAAAESGGVYSLYLEHYYKINYMYYYESYEPDPDEDRYLPGEEIQLIGEMHKDLGDEYFNGWLLDDLVHPGYTGNMTYTVNENDATDYAITFYGQYMLKISDINGEAAAIDSRYKYTYKEAKDISYHIGGLNFSDLENNNPATDTEVYLDKNGNGSYEADEKLVYGTEYTATSGSIVITIDKDVLNTLPIGNHNVQIIINAFYNDPDNVDTFTFNSALKVTRKKEESVYRVVNTCTK